MTALADHLRALPDDGLTALFRLRTDLAVPVPADLSALAARVQSRVSVARAIDPLDRFTLEILDALRLTRTGDVTSVDAVLTLAGTGRAAPEPATIRSAIDRLRARFLVYGPEHALHVAAGVDEVSSLYPAGLGRPAAELDPAAAELCADAAGLRRTVLAAPPAARAVLDRLAAGPPVGTTTAATSADPDSPVGWLVLRHLLIPTSDETVELPSEVALLLRRDVGPLGHLHPQPPALDGPRRSVKTVDSAGAGQAMEAVRLVEELLEALGTEAVPVLKSGGLGVRELRRLARTVGVDEAAVAALVEIAAAAGLLGEADLTTASGRGVKPTDPAAPTGEARFLPTTWYDHWRNRSIAERWTQLARAWLVMPRQPGLVGRRDERDRLLAALAPELERVGAPALRSAALAVLADGEVGLAPEPDDVLAVLAWRSPRRFGGASPPMMSASADAVRCALAEAALLGLTGLGALTGYGRRLFDELTSAAQRDPDEDPLGLGVDDAPGGSTAAGALDQLLPPPVDHVLVQADLTVVLPGPAEPGLAAELALIAEPESANVFRVTSDSIRRALDAGYGAADLHGLFARRSRTDIPQGLTYLIDDVARRHGGLRLGPAGAYLRSDDEVLLTELLTDRRLVELALRRLAPTVLITPYPSGRLLAVLRDAGYPPVPEDASGATVLSRPRVRRAPAHRPTTTLRSIVDGHPRLPAARLAGIVEQLRRADAVAQTARRAPVSLRAAAGGTAAQAHTQAMAVLQQAVRDKSRVWVGYVDAHGGTAARLVRPVSLGAGYLRAEDDRTETLHTFALHRITAAVVEE
jgi:hypothetical protein